MTENPQKSIKGIQDTVSETVTEFSKPPEEETHVIGSTSWGDYCYSLAFFVTTLALRPEKVVELGVYEGFASYQVASALKCLGKGKLDSYDLWEDYEFTHCKKEVAEKNLIGLNEFVTLYKRDAKDVHKEYEDSSVDMLILDISNDGTIYRDYLYNWYPKLSDRAIVLCEGGTDARDNVPWMKKYLKTPILKTLRTDSFILSHYNYGITEVYPGMTILVKKEF